MRKFRRADWIKAHLEQQIAHHPDCRGARVVVVVRRDDGGSPPWVVDVQASEELNGPCTDRVRQLIDDARRQFEIY